MNVRCSTTVAWLGRIFEGGDGAWLVTMRRPGNITYDRLTCSVSMQYNWRKHNFDRLLRMKSMSLLSTSSIRKVPDLWDDGATLRDICRDASPWENWVVGCAAIVLWLIVRKKHVPYRTMQFSWLAQSSAVPLLRPISIWPTATASAICCFAALLEVGGEQHNEAKRRPLKILAE